jgi:F-type H+-transporting ATPase subunit b
MFFLAFAETIQLFPDGTIFIHIALVLGMIWVLNRTYFRPINRVLEARDRSKGGAGGEAGSILSDAAAKESQYQAEIREARARGYQIIEQKHTQAVAERESRLGTVKSEVSTQLASERAALEKQAAEARAAISAEADQIADRIAANILKS